MSSKRIKKPIRKKNKSDYPGEMSFRKALGNNPIYYQEDNSTIPVTVKYGTPEYEQAYNQGTLTTRFSGDPQDFVRARTLPEFKVTPQYTSLYDDLGYLALEGSKGLAELTGVPGTVRFARNPVQSLKGAGNTLVDLGMTIAPFARMNPAGGIQYATQGVNPLTGEGSYRAEDVEGAFNTLDALGTATVLGSTLKAPVTAGMKQLRRYVPRQLPGSPNAGRGLKQAAKNNLFKKLNTKKTQFSKALQGSSNLFNEIIGELKQGKLNRKSIEEGNKWLENYINHPSTQMRIDIAAEDAIKNINQKYSWLGNSPEDIPFKQALINEDANFINLVREQTKKFKPNSKEYSLLKQFKDNLQQYLSIKAEAPIHLNNWGVSYMHNVNPSSRELIKTGAAKPFDRYGSWISRTASQSQPNRVSTTIHEGGHDWLSAEAFETLGQKKIALDPNNVAQEAIDSYLKKEQLIDAGKTSEEILEILGEKENYVAYLAEPTEQHVRIMELRAAANLPADYSMDEATAKKMLEWIESGHSPVEKSFAYIVDYDANKLKNLFNKFLVAPTVMGVGAAGTYGANQLTNQQQMRRQGGKLYYQEDVGQLPTLYVDPNDPAGRARYEAYQDSSKIYNRGERDFNETVNFYKNYRNGMFSLVPVNNPTSYYYQTTKDIYKTRLRPSSFYESNSGADVFLPRWKKPVQPIIYKQPQQEQPTKINTTPRNIHQYPFRHPVTGETEDRVSLITPAHQYIMNMNQYGKLGPTDSIPQEGNYLYRTNYKELGGKLRFARGGSLTSAQDTAQAADLNKDVMRKDYKKPTFWQNIGAAGYGVFEGTVDAMTFGLTDELTDAGFKGLQSAAGITGEEAQKQQGIAGFGNIAGAVIGGFANPAAATYAVEEGLEGLGKGIKGTNPSNQTTQSIGNAIEMMGPQASKLFSKFKSDEEEIPEGMEGFSKIFMARNGGRFRYGYQGGGHMLNQNMGLTEIDGPSHEEGGVTLPNNGGRPDVEVEGPETIYTPENYVMSEKMKASLEALEFAGITGKAAKRLAGKSYADLSKMIKSKAGDKLRPNDPLSKKMLDKEMKKLMMAHEYDREAKRMQEEAMRSQMMGGSNIVAETPEERAGGYNMYPNAQSIAFPGSGPTSVVPTYNNDPIMVTGADGSQQMLTDEPIETQAPFIEEKMAQGGKMIKRADGSYSRRGLWDNIRANRGSGKKPTKQMLEQEAKIKAAEKAYGGYYADGGKLYYQQDNSRLPLNTGYTIPASNKKKGYTINQGYKPVAESTRVNTKVPTKNPLINAGVYYTNKPSNPVSPYVHSFLDYAGLAPGLGEPFDAVNALLYEYEGDRENALISAAATIPYAGMYGPMSRQYKKLANLGTQESIQEGLDDKRGYKFGGSFDNPGFRALPGYVQAKIKSNMEVGGYMGDYIGDDDTMEYGKGGYTVRRSNDRKGKTHVVIGPDGTKKYFGDPKLGERGKSKYGKDAFYARHKKNLAKNPYFRAYARATWEDGGYMDMLNANVDIPDMEAPMYQDGGPFLVPYSNEYMSQQYADYKNFYDDYTRPPSNRTMGDGYDAYDSYMRRNIKKNPIYASGWLKESKDGTRKIFYDEVDNSEPQPSSKYNVRRVDNYMIGSQDDPIESKMIGDMSTTMAWQNAADRRKNRFPQNMYPGFLKSQQNGGQLSLYRDGGIHIDPAKRGTFKAQASKMGMGVQEAARTILNAPEGKYSPAMRKKANFARNFAKEYGGYYQMGGEMMQAPQQGQPQGGGGEEQILQQVAQMLQQGMSPEEIVGQLVQMGVPQEQAIQVVQMVVQQMQGQQQAPQQEPQQAPPMMRGGGYMYQMGGEMAPQQQAQGGEEQIVQAITEMLQQGMQPEEIVAQLVQMGLPQEAAIQAVQMVMQQSQQGQQQQMPAQAPAPMMRYGGRVTKQMGGSLADNYLSQVNQYPVLKRNGGKLYYQQDEGYLDNTTKTLENMINDDSIESGIYEGPDAIAIGNQANANAARANSLVNSSNIRPIRINRPSLVEQATYLGGVNPQGIMPSVSRSFNPNYSMTPDERKNWLNKTKGYSGLLPDEGYEAIDMFENTMGTYDSKGNPTSMNMPEGYSKTGGRRPEAVTETEKYINNTIGIDTWNSLPDDIKTLWYDASFNSTDNKEYFLRALAQAVQDSDPNFQYPQNIGYTDNDYKNYRNNLSDQQALEIIRNADFTKNDVTGNFINILNQQRKSIGNRSGFPENYMPTFNRRAIDVYNNFQNLNSNQSSNPQPGNTTSAAPTVVSQATAAPSNNQSNLKIGILDKPSNTPAGNFQRINPEVYIPGAYTPPESIGFNAKPPVNMMQPSSVRNNYRRDPSLFKIPLGTPSASTPANDTEPSLPEYKSPMGNYIAGGVGSMFGPLANIAAAAFAPDPTYTAAPKFKKFDYTPVALQRAAGNQAMANTRQAIRMGAPTQGSYLANVGVSMPSAGAQIGSQVAQTRYGIDSQNIGLMNQEAQLRAAQAEKNALMKDQSISNRWKLGMEAAAGVGRNIQGFSKDMGAKEMQDQLLNQLRTGDFAIIGYDNVNGTLVPKLAPAGVATYNDGTITLSNGQRARRNPDTGKYEIIPQ